MSHSNIERNLDSVRKSINEAAAESGRDPRDITLVAVSKTRSLAEVEQAIKAGQIHFGENTMQDALSKIPDLKSHNLHWHFIGHLQSKKAKQIPGNFHWVHSIDSFKLAQKLSSAINNTDEACKLNCLFQVNVSAEASKSGMSPADVIPFIDQCLDTDLPGLIWRGLMTIGVQGDENQTRSAFAGLRDLRDECQSRFNLDSFDQLSMGMSNDYVIAIQEGATLVRIGALIFGARNKNQ